MNLEDDVDVDELAMSASALLNQYRKRGINDDIGRRVLNNTHEARNLERLKGLVAKFEAAIQVHDAEVAAAHTALVRTIRHMMRVCMRILVPMKRLELHHHQRMHHHVQLLPVLPKAFKATPKEVAR
jgi:hypothetical protein